MESFALLRGGLPSKLPLLKPSPSTPMSVMPSWLCFNVRNPPFPRLSNGSVLTCVSIGSTRNPNIRDKLLARCGDGETYSNAEEDSLKALISLVQPKESNSSTLVIASTKNEALKLVVEEKYGEALCHTKNLCSFAKAEVVYEARLAHLQILIRLDEYDKALEFLEEKDNFPQSFEARLSLYKAVVHTMLGNGDKAEEWWNTYLETLGNGNAIGLTALGNHKDAKICWKCFMKTIGVFNPFEHQSQ
ncbi:hypothetical protein SDJN02_25277, partial [Cucurbita argyrosperma subsp. argyrosperma]